MGRAGTLTGFAVTAILCDSCFKANSNIAALLECTAEPQRSPFCSFIDTMEKPLVLARFILIACTEQNK
jgi:hypothetical protein